MDKMHFLRQLFKDKNVAAVTPSSKFVVNKLCKKMDLSRDRVIVEYGPGNGALVKRILKKLTPASRFIAIETNEGFVKHLRKIEDERLIVINGSAEDVRTILEKLGIEKADYAVSSIPFSYLNSRARAQIVENTYSVLKPGGKFIVYQATWHSAKPLKQAFGDFDMDLELRNVPPFFFFVASKPPE